MTEKGIGRGFKSPLAHQTDFVIDVWEKFLKVAARVRVEFYSKD